MNKKDKQEVKDIFSIKIIGMLITIFSLIYLFGIPSVNIDTLTTIGLAKEFIGGLIFIFTLLTGMYITLT